MRVKWRLLSRNQMTGKGEFAPVIYDTKKRALSIAKVFNNYSKNVKWEVYKQEGNKKTRVF